MAKYIALLDGEPGAIGIAFPDLPGCTAMGKDENEAYVHAIEALSEWILDAREHGPEPAPRSVFDLRADPDVKEALAAGAIFIFIPLIIESGRSVKANLSLDAGLLEAIDAAARESGLTRSNFLASAAREKIANTSRRSQQMAN